MPWLVKGQENVEENLFFVHVPRCGGTSLTQHFSVPRKCTENRSWWGKLGMTTFFRRYKQLESENFPHRTTENALALLLGLISICLYFVDVNDDGQGGHALLLFLPSSLLQDKDVRQKMATALFALAASIFISYTYLFTAPVIGRVSFVHRSYLWFIHYPMAQFMESVEWCTGTNNKGYMMHLTAQKLLAYGYVMPEVLDSGCSSMAIVRNPYSRMVSIYMYNRFGATESFKDFLQSWAKMMIPYIEDGEMEEYHTPCHCIPQFEYTHYEGKQLVQAIVKQEELKFLKTEEGMSQALAQDNTVANLPPTVRRALLGMPHTNARGTKKKWWEYYDQDTLDLTYRLYEKDFDVFGYKPTLDQRPDLVSPTRGAGVAAAVEAAPSALRSSFRAGKIRHVRYCEPMRRNSSIASSTADAKERLSLMRKSASKRSGLLDSFTVREWLQEEKEGDSVDNGQGDGDGFGSARTSVSSIESLARSSKDKYA